MRLQLQSVMQEREHGWIYTSIGVKDQIMLYAGARITHAE